MVKVKICGLTNSADALAASALGAHALGFILTQRSPRYLEPETARDIIATLPPFVCKVGVFVNAPAESVNAIAATIGLNLVQLHGEESPEYCNQIAVPVIKAFRVHDNFDINLLKRYTCSAYLLDAYSTGSYGGTGKAFDWAIARKAATGARIILAGGITPENVSVAITTVSPYAVDVSSGVELAPGRKDHDKMQSLFERLKQCNSREVNQVSEKKI